MKKPPPYWYKAKKILSKRDPVLRKIIKKYNKGFLTTKNKPFFSLCRTIIGQQISTKAADSIWIKFESKCQKKINPKRKAVGKIRKISDKKKKILKNKKDIVEKPKNKFLKTLWKRRKKAS